MKQTRKQKVEALHRYFYIHYQTMKKGFFLNRTIKYDMSLYTTTGKYPNKLLLVAEIIKQMKIKRSKHIIILILSIVELKHTDYIEFNLQVTPDGQPVKRGKQHAKKN